MSTDPRTFMVSVDIGTVEQAVETVYMLFADRALTIELIITQDQKVWPPWIFRIVLDGSPAQSIADILNDGRDDN